MPRWLVTSIAVALVAAWGVTIALTAGGGPKVEPHSYVVELDNAFGLTVGSDVKLGGVEAGAIKSLNLNQHTRRAEVGIRLTLPGFDALNHDAFCQVRPQSLIGEYYLDCQPGRGRPLKAGSVIPVSRAGRPSRSRGIAQRWRSIPERSARTRASCQVTVRPSESRCQPRPRFVSPATAAVGEAALANTPRESMRRNGSPP